MQTAARAASSTARLRSRSPNGSLPLVRANWTRPTTVSWATIGTASVDCTRPPSSAGTARGRAVRASAQGELNG
ncbi:hypothetical protein SVIOM342S_01032 [Streptomyces violaceorubidus]